VKGDHENSEHTRRGSAAPMSSAEEGISDWPTDVVRTRRLEIVDVVGRVRVVVGDIGGATPGVFGIAVLDEAGQHRAWLALHDTGPALVFDHEGNNVIHLGVEDARSDALHHGATFHLSDDDGRPVYSWWVEQDGTLGTGGSFD
jgi:hypothetical protein